MLRIPMIFPGQASQAVGMTADLAGRVGPAAEFLASIDDLIGAPLTHLMYDGPAEVLTETRNAQPAILAHSVAVVLALRELEIYPTLVAGHSLGEYSAAVAVGALTAADGLRAVRRRGELMFAAGQTAPGSMAAVLGLPAERVQEICTEVSASVGVVVLANHNSSTQVAISGEIAAVEAAMVRLKESGARRVVRLNVSGAFHSPLLEDAAAQFADYLGDVAIADCEVPLVANVSASPVSRAADLRAGFERQLTAPVLWRDTMEFLVGEADRTVPLILEVGPGRVLTNLARREYPQVTFLPVGTADDLESLPQTLAEKLNEAGSESR